jgi:hypothetical protein
MSSMPWSVDKRSSASELVPANLSGMGAVCGRGNIVPREQRERYIGDFIVASMVQQVNTLRYCLQLSRTTCL